MATGKPNGKKEKPEAEVTPRLKGADVHFPVTSGYPEFLLKAGEFSVRQNVEKASERFAFARLAGELQGLTSHPALYGKTTVFRLKGALVGETAREVALSGELDHRQTPADDHIDLIIKDLRLERPGENNSGQSPLLLTSAFLDVDAGLQIKGENLGGQVLVSIRQPKVEVGSEARILTDLFNNLGPFEVKLSISGTLNQPVMGLTSSATKTLSAALKKILHTQQKEIRQNLKKAINARIDKKLLTANDEADTLERRILSELSSRLDLAGIVSKQGPKRGKT